MSIGAYGATMPLRMKLAGLYLPADPGRISQIVNIAVQHQHCSLKPIFIPVSYTHLTLPTKA